MKTAVLKTPADSHQVIQSKGGHSLRPPAYGVSFIDKAPSTPVVQLMKPTEKGAKYIVNLEKSEVEMIYVRPRKTDNGEVYLFKKEGSSMTIPIEEKDVLRPAGASSQPLSGPLLPPTRATPSASFNENKNTVRTFEKDTEQQSDETLSAEFPELLAENHPDYEPKIKSESETGKRIAKLRADTKRLRENMPPDHVELWRFHSSSADYQSHAYQKGKNVSDKELREARANPNAHASHMYQSSSKNNSPGVSYTRSLDSLLDATYHTGGDTGLKHAVHGGGKRPPSSYVSYTQIPKSELILPEKTPVPHDAPDRDKKGLARRRAMNETEALHIPLPGSRGRTYPPLKTFDNPFGQEDLKRRKRGKAATTLAGGVGIGALAYLGFGAVGLPLLLAAGAGALGGYLLGKQIWK